MLEAQGVVDEEWLDPSRLINHQVGIFAEVSSESINGLTKGKCMLINLFWNLLAKLWKPG